METYEISWTSRAKKDLRRLYDFYTKTIGEDKAFEIIEKVLERVDLLSNAKFVRMGAVDEDFRHLKHQYKKVIEKGIKITYRLSTSKPLIYINRVFDTRQHPSKNR
ncbi:MAG: type II toxin-antitoxin system RelE/ParE family toxin [Tenuifilaceae bacterium]|nr:type II toxin-antitoxin system RelE/ParE family toxin [Tenuifilaceae bacterium]